MLRIETRSAMLTKVLKLLVLCASVHLLMSGSILAQTEILTDLVEDSPTPAGDKSSSIVLENTQSDDAEVRQRLISIISEIDRLDQVTVDVSNSVVQLQGEVESSEAKAEAEDLAVALEGVVKVDNQIEISRDVSDRVRSTWDRLVQLATDMRSLLPLLFLAVGVVVLFWFFARVAGQQTALWSKLTPNEFIATILGTVVRLIILLVGIILALYLLDATSIITTVLGAAGIVGLALGFAVRDTVENFIASILLSLRQPFQMNDFVEIGSHQGSVARLTGRATILISADGNQIRIPNAVVFKSTIINFTRHPQRRFDLRVPIDESEDLLKARKIALDAIASVPGVMTSPSAQVHIQSLGEAIVELTTYGWIDQRTHDLNKIRTATAVAIKNSLKNAQIVMPQSVHTLKLIDSSVSADIQPSSESTDKAGTMNNDPNENVTESQAPERSSGVDDLTTLIESSDDGAVNVQLEEEQSGSENLLGPGKSE